MEGLAYLFAVMLGVMVGQVRGTCDMVIGGRCFPSTLPDPPRFSVFDSEASFNSRCPAQANALSSCYASAISTCSSAAKRTIGLTTFKVLLYAQICKGKYGDVGKHLDCLRSAEGKGNFDKCEILLGQSATFSDNVAICNKVNEAFRCYRTAVEERKTCSAKEDATYMGRILEGASSELSTLYGGCKITAFTDLTGGTGGSGGGGSAGVRPYFGPLTTLLPLLFSLHLMK